MRLIKEKEKFSPTTFDLQVAKTRIVSFTFQFSLRLNLLFKQMRLQGSLIFTVKDITFLFQPTSGEMQRSCQCIFAIIRKLPLPLDG